MVISGFQAGLGLFGWVAGLGVRGFVLGLVLGLRLWVSCCTGLGFV